MNLLERMSWSNKMNLFFVAIMVPVLLFWSFSLISSMRNINQINSDQLEECYRLDCEVTYFGGIKCKETRMGDKQFQLDGLSSNTTVVNQTK